jgi:sulfonate transport system permease protein
MQTEDAREAQEVKSHRRKNVATGADSTTTQSAGTTSNRKEEHSMSAEQVSVAKPAILQVVRAAENKVETRPSSTLKRWVGERVLSGWHTRLLGVVLPFLLLTAWQVSSSLHWVKPIFLPSPWSVIQTFREMLVEEGLLTDFRVSAVIVIEGFLIGAVFGLAAGVAAGLSKTVEKLLGPLLNSIRQVPPVAWLPLIVLWVGIGPLAKGIMIGKAVFFPVFLNTLQGIRGVSKDYVEVARIFEYNQRLLLRKVVIPAALPSIFVGLRYGAGLAWAVVIMAEMLGGKLGLGYLLVRSQELLLTQQLFVIIVIIGGVGFSVDVVLRRMEGNLLRWKKGFEG